MNTRKSMETTYKEVINGIKICMMTLVGILACNAVYCRDVCEKIQEFFHNCSCVNRVLFATIKSGVQEYTIINWGLLFSVLLILDLIMAYKRVKAELAIQKLQDNSMTNTIAVKNADRPMSAESLNQVEENADSGDEGKRNISGKALFYRFIEDMIWLGWIVLDNANYLEKIGYRIEKLYYGFFCDSALFFTTIKNGTNEHTLINWGEGLLVVFFLIHFIIIYKKVKRVASTKDEEASGITEK